MCVVESRTIVGGGYSAIAPHRESDTAGAKTFENLQVLSDFIYFVNTSIYLSVWYHKNLCDMILLEMSLCITVWHAL